MLGNKMRKFFGISIEIYKANKSMKKDHHLFFKSVGVAVLVGT